VFLRPVFNNMSLPSGVKFSSSGKLGPQKWTLFPTGNFTPPSLTPRDAHLYCLKECRGKHDLNPRGQSSPLEWPTGGWPGGQNYVVTWGEFKNRPLAARETHFLLWTACRKDRPMYGPYKRSCVGVEVTPWLRCSSLVRFHLVVCLHKAILAN
jgi:hypothetical protein